MAFFIPFNFVTLLYFYSITSSVLITKLVLITKKLQNERNEDFLHIWLLHRITFYQKTYKIRSLDTNQFLNTDVCINNPHWQSSEIISFLCKCYIVILDTLVGSFCALFIAHCNIIRALWKTKKEIELQRLSYRKKNKSICVWEITFLTARSPFYVIFCCFLSLLPS